MLVKQRWHLQARRLRAAGLLLWLEQISMHQWEINDLPNEDEPVPGRQGWAQFVGLGGGCAALAAPAKVCVLGEAFGGGDMVRHVQNRSQVQGL